MPAPEPAAPQARPSAERPRSLRDHVVPVAAPLAVTALFVGGLAAVSGLARAGEPAPDGTVAAAAAAEPEAVASMDLDQIRAQRESIRVSRSSGRPATVARAVELRPEATDHEFATAPLNIWRGPGEQGPKIGVLDEGTKVAVTGLTAGRWTEVVLVNPERGRVGRWVNGDYLAEKKPKPERESAGGAVTGGLSSAPCPDGSSIESGITSNAVRVYRAVCAAFPQPTTYGGYDPHGEHIDGRAIDIMISGETGWQIAEWLRANASSLGIRDIIYSQRIWTPEQASAGWRYMSDRGSSTANHYDHVHVAVF